MEISKKIEGNVLTLAPVGKLDACVESDVEAAVRENIEGIENLIFDFADVEYISSAGIRVVVSAVKLLAGKGEVSIKNANDEIVDVFDLVGLKTLIDCD